MKKYGKKTDQLYFNALAYDAVMLFAEVVKKTETTNLEEIVRNIYQIKNKE